MEHRSTNQSFGPLPSAVAVLAAAAILAAATVFAGVNILIPEESSYAPVYARPGVESATLLPCGDWEWVPIIFYRPPECVPETFNLLQFYDVPGAFFCPVLVEGHMVMEYPPDSPVAQVPRLVNVRQAQPMPMYFVSVQDWVSVVFDDFRVTVSDLEALPSFRIGWADFYHETLAPVGAPGAAGPQVPHWNYRAHGTFEDGGTFRLHLAGQVHEDGGSNTVCSLEMD
jgi:hypothetical protein